MSQFMGERGRFVTMEQNVTLTSDETSIFSPPFWMSECSLSRYAYIPVHFKSKCYKEKMWSFFVSGQNALGRSWGGRIFSRHPTLVDKFVNLATCSVSHVLTVAE